MISPDKNGLYHPSKEVDIIELIKHARSNRLQVRVRGASQSIDQAVFTDKYPKGNGINIQLDKFRTIEFDDATMQVTAGAGCNLKVDPFDPTSIDGSGLYQQLTKKGWAIANVPDAAHQTVAGFMSTGSAGGSTMHSFDECLVSLTLIDGTGAIRVFKRSANKFDPFYGAGTSMGLLGVIISVTLQCIKNFNIIGKYTSHNADACEFDFGGVGNKKKPSLQKFFSEKEFARLLWWPFPTVHRILTWQARTMKPGDYNSKTGTPKKFKPQPYQPTFPAVSVSKTTTTLPARLMAAVGFRMLGMWPDWLKKLIPDNRSEQEVQQIMETDFPFLYPKMLDLFFPLSERRTHPVQIFWDKWSGSLEVDEQEFSDKLFNMVYTEIWVDIKHTQKLIKTLQSHYKVGGLKATWFYCVEILGAKKSEFWMSPGYGRNSIRVSIMWWTTNAKPAMEYYQQFWDLLKRKGIPFRLHWGKYLPPPTSAENPKYLLAQYPKWENFNSLRKQMDPDDIFLTSYWKAQLGIS